MLSLYSDKIQYILAPPTNCGWTIIAVVINLTVLMRFVFVNEPIMLLW